MQQPKAGSARTGPLPLHPMTLSDIVDGAFKLLKANVKTIVMIAAVFVIPLQFVSAFLQRGILGGHGFLDVMRDPSLVDSGSFGSSTGQYLGTALTALVGLLVTPLVGGAITRVVAASYLGEELPFGPAIRTTLRRLPALLLALLAVHLLELAGALFCLIGALVPMTFFVATTPALVIEEIGPIRAMARSATLLRPRFWPVLGTVVVAGLMASIVGSIISLPFTLVAELIGLGHGWPLLAVGSIVPALLTTPFAAIVATLLYFDGRIRQEGFDLQMVAAELSGGGVPA